MKQILTLGGVIIGPLFAIITFAIIGDAWTFRELRVVFAVGLCLRCLNSMVLLFFDDSKVLGEESSAIVETGRTTGFKYQNCVPYIILTSDFITSMGSGMTVKFFPLFFKNEVHMTPSQVNYVNLISFSLMMVFTYLSGKVSSRFGRIQTILLAAACGLSFLVLMVELKKY